MAKSLCSVSDFSFETLVKLQVKINELQEYFLFYKKYKSQFSDELNGDRISPRKVFSSMAHRVIYVLYRSLFKDIENKTIDPLTIDGFKEIKGIHDGLIEEIVDKDICHNDKNSKTFKLLNVDSLLNNNGSSVIVQSYLSDDELERILNFLINKFLPKIQNTEIKVTR
ncbi:MAG: hypothetical protein V1819_02410 [bacterium]